LPYGNYLLKALAKLDLMLSESVEHQRLDIPRRDAHSFLGLQAVPSSHTAGFCSVAAAESARTDISLVELIKEAFAIRNQLLHHKFLPLQVSIDAILTVDLARAACPDAKSTRNNIASVSAPFGELGLMQVETNRFLRAARYVVA
jgi:hypothetical protein